VSEDERVIKVSDYIARFLADHGVRNVHLVAGGGMMHLLDSVGREPRLRYWCNHHEQASAIAAEAEARVTGRVGVCYATTGPGATNALSGIVGAWYDSVPVLVISGQVRTEVRANYEVARQLGPQEANIQGMASPVTKYFATVSEPRQIRRELERALHHACDGRPGPVWLDIPLDVQAATVEEEELVPGEIRLGDDGGLPPTREALSRALAAILEAKRPVLLAGNGVHLARGRDDLRRLVEHLSIPTLLTIGGADLLEEDHPLYFGRVGPIGQRRANFVLQNSDLVLAVGASLCLASIGFNTDAFAPHAKKILVNVDPAELAKKTIRQEKGVLADARAFCKAFVGMVPAGAADRPGWLGACRDFKTRYPTLMPDYFADRDHVSAYVFAAELGKALSEDAVVVTGNSMDFWALYQAMPTKRHQRFFTNLNFGAMGWDLGAAIGACAGRGGAKTVLVTGDGGMQTNVQELTTIGHNRMNIKVFVFSNAGYQSIRATQETFFNSHYVGSSAETGVGIPSFPKLADATGLGYARIRNNAELASEIPKVLASDGPVLCEVMLSPTQERLPRVKSYRREDGVMVSPALEDMYPPLPADEIRRNMRWARGDAD
jgi:acetolactate synthase-1/2/3 large subunit